VDINSCHTNCNYLQVVPNSHFFTDLEQIIALQKYNHKEFNSEYIIIGLSNSELHGYSIKKTIKSNWYLDIGIWDLIEYIKSGEYSADNLITRIAYLIQMGYNLTNDKKMERKEVYRQIDNERDYQDLRWNSNLREGDIPDEEKPVAEWINYIEYHLNKAKTANYQLNKESSLAELRKVAALAVRALEIHGCPERMVQISYSASTRCYGNCDCK